MAKMMLMARSKWRARACPKASIAAARAEAEKTAIVMKAAAAWKHEQKKTERPNAAIDETARKMAAEVVKAELT